MLDFVIKSKKVGGVAPDAAVTEAMVRTGVECTVRRCDCVRDRLGCGGRAYHLTPLGQGLVATITKCGSPRRNGTRNDLVENIKVQVTRIPAGNQNAYHTLLARSLSFKLRDIANTRKGPSSETQWKMMSSWHVINDRSGSARPSEQNGNLIHDGYNRVDLHSSRGNTLSRYLNLALTAVKTARSRWQSL